MNFTIYAVSCNSATHAIRPLALKAYKYNELQNVLYNSKIELQCKLQNTFFSHNETMPKFVWIQKFCEGQIVMECFWHLEKLNMTRPSKKHNNNQRKATNNSQFGTNYQPKIHILDKLPATTKAHNEGC